MKHIVKTKMLAVLLAVFVAAVSIGAGGYIIYNSEELPKDMEGAQVIETASVEEPGEENGLGQEEELPEETPSEEPEEPPRELSLAGTSIERDLKIKIEDQEARLVTGEAFAVSVQADKKNAKASDYEDKDKDGIIYIDSLEAGNYTVALHDVEGYTVKKGSLSVTVKDKIEYKKVDVASEIKKESQVNPAAEDTAVNDIPVESVLEDTVPFLESRVETTAVEKKDVDTSNFTSASADGEETSQTVEKKPAGGSGDAEEDEGAEGSEGAGSAQAPADSGDEGSVEEPSSSDGPGGRKDAPDSGDIDSEGAVQALSSAQADPAKARRVQAMAETEKPAKSKSAGLSTENGSAAATISVPSKIKLYDADNESSKSYKIVLTITGDDSIIRGIKWSSTDNSVVTLSGTEGEAVIVEAKANGSAKIQAEVAYEMNDEGDIDYATLESTVTVSGMSDSVAELKDRAGNTLYVDDQAQKKAVLKDYSSQDTFYTEPQYTGWQTIGGKMYYYNEDHKPVTGRQVIGGVEYHFGDDGALMKGSGSRGIDVSKYQANIDWNAVAASGIEFAIIRVGYRGSRTGVLVEDPYFKRNISGATKAGIKVGVYFFTQAVTEAEAVEEASMAMSLVSGYKLSYPIFIDTESAVNGRANYLSRRERTAVVEAFCETVQNGGYRAGVYASKSWYNDQLKVSHLNNYYIWVAQYNTQCTYGGRYDMWQYTSKGAVAGIKGNVDMNISY